jgi:hypothetical protein
MHDPEPGFEAVCVAGFRRRRVWRVCALIAAAALMHAVVLTGADWIWPPAEPAHRPAAAMRVRVVDVPVAIVRPVAFASMALAAAESPRAHAAVALAKDSPSLAAAKRVESPTPPIPFEEAKARVDEAPTTLAQNPPVANAAPVPPADEEPVPTYRTVTPPAVMLHYELLRGTLRGTGDLAWRPKADRYELRLDAKVSGLSVLTQISTGAFDDGGIAPARYTDQRIRKSMTAANFQRGLPSGGDKITFSGSSAVFPLHAGAQDRLSWMVQLAAIVSAEPQLAQPGAKIVLFVAGANGDASVWVFKCLGPEIVDSRTGPVEAFKFMREPRELYDTAIQVWLDPKQHDLPIRATQKSGPNDEGYELRLIDAAPLD